MGLSTTWVGRAWGRRLGGDNRRLARLRAERLRALLAVMPSTCSGDDADSAAASSAAPPSLAGQGRRSHLVCIVAPTAELRERLQDLLRAALYRTKTYPGLRSVVDSALLESFTCAVVEIQGKWDREAKPFAQLAEVVRFVGCVAIVRHGDVSGAVAAVHSGANEVIELPIEVRAFWRAVESSIRVTLKNRETRTQKRALVARYGSLTRREREVLELVVEGLTSSAIAEQLGVRVKTVEVYRSHVKQKMRARNSADLVRMVNVLQ